MQRLTAWLILSGIIVHLAKTVMPRSDALVVPFVVAGLGAAIVVAAGWRALGRGFAGGV